MLTTEKINEFMIAALPPNIQSEARQAHTRIQRYIDDNHLTWDYVYAKAVEAFQQESGEAANDDCSVHHARLMQMLGGDETLADEIVSLCILHRQALAIYSSLQLLQIEQSSPRTRSMPVIMAADDLNHQRELFEFRKALELLGAGPVAAKESARRLEASLQDHVYQRGSLTAR